MPMPPSWKSEVQEAVKETINRSEHERKNQESAEHGEIAKRIDALKCYFESAGQQEKRPKKIKIMMDALTLVFVALTAIFTGLAWCVFHGQLTEMQTEQRPWVYATDIAIAGRIIAEAETFAIPLRFSIKNTGHLPAFSVEPKTGATVLKIAGHKRTIDVTNDICDAYRNSPTKGGMTVFADQTVTHGGFTGDDYPRVSKQEWKAIGGDWMIVMYGCIDYRFPDQPGHHQSRFSFAVGELKNQGILERIGSLPADPTTVDVRMLPVPINDGIPAN